MATVYEKADAEVNDLVASIIKKHYPLLKEAGVTVQVLMASNDKAPPVMLHGRECYATIRSTKLKERVVGQKDTEMLIDQKKYDKLPPQSKAALIDHELQHIGLTGKFDDIGRPKISMRHHDWEIAGFKVIAERHGDFAIEVQQANTFKLTFGQCLFEFARG